MIETSWVFSASMNAPEGLKHIPLCSNPSLSLCSNVRVTGGHAASGWQAGSLTMWPAVKICPGSYSVSVLECADVGERKVREGGCCRVWG